MHTLWIDWKLPYIKQNFCSLVTLNFSLDFELRAAKTKQIKLSRIGPFSTSAKVAIPPENSKIQIPVKNYSNARKLQKFCSSPVLILISIQRSCDCHFCGNVWLYQKKYHQILHQLHLDFFGLDCCLSYHSTKSRWCI